MNRVFAYILFCFLGLMGYSVSASNNDTSKIPDAKFGSFLQIRSKESVINKEFVTKVEELYEKAQKAHKKRDKVYGAYDKVSSHKKSPKELSKAFYIDFRTELKYFKALTKYYKSVVAELREFGLGKSAIEIEEITKAVDTLTRAYNEYKKEIRELIEEFIELGFDQCDECDLCSEKADVIQKKRIAFEMVEREFAEKLEGKFVRK
ncbi:hypothetical protein Q7M76_04775 [Candidatus Liberibacter asiaticus]|nr:hypothetical protein [Candidatus Liberibacter asiaticus]KAE9511450.1 hypothetical protein FXW31_01410 [Candidatus Liberibacter asiaticus]KAE9511875.1 hypothetical protein FXW32_04675 [Candidatus Liberibacter asiaticus]KAE9512962.1 hypothetical protein FXW35_04710 [Candidatus Liberibacter asiaticus]KAE9514042.1 hypothetical protein FXW25_04430 [Candidatus Liberibacter asiaticus]KAE9515100.1 hypothetical protein FXW26_04575 [Candidatus Liberibacter asiaticus]